MKRGESITKETLNIRPNMQVFWSWLTGSSIRLYHEYLRRDMMVFSHEVSVHITDPSVHGGANIGPPMHFDRGHTISYWNNALIPEIRYAKSHTNPMPGPYWNTHTQYIPKNMDDLLHFALFRL